MSTENIRAPQCPKCNSESVIPILYGEPNDEGIAAAYRNELVLGGCIVDDGLPIWHCQDCGYNFGELNLDNEVKGDDLDSILGHL
jgi:hypothetical protein